MSLNGLTQHIAGAALFHELAHAVRDCPGGGLPPLALPRAARPLMVAALRQALDRPVLYLVASIDQARLAADVARSLSAGGDEAGVLRFVEPNTAFYDTVAPVTEIVAQRSRVLASLGGARPAALIVASTRALMHPTTPVARHRAGMRVIQRDQTLALENMLAHWINIGYQNEPVVERTGAFSRRGGIIDVWPPSLFQPARIELFGDQVDSIRLFDPGTQRSQDQLERMVITPMESGAGSGTPASLMEYLGRDGLLIVDDEQELAEEWATMEARARRERETFGGAPGDEASLPYLTWADYLAGRQRLNCALTLGYGAAGAGQSDLAAHFAPPPHFVGQLPAFIDHVRSQSRREAGEPEASAAQVVVVSRQARRLAEMWSERVAPIAAADDLDAPPAGSPTFVNGMLAEGVEFTAEPAAGRLLLFTDAEIFGQVRPEPSGGRARKLAPERAFSDWKPGDAVVHEDYGIGVYRGLVQLTVNTGTPSAPAEGTREYLLLEYADADRLYVPLHQLDRVSRYVGGEDDRPVLNKLGTPDWVQVKHRARGAAAEVARDMLKLYAEREMATGHAFGPDTPWQAELEASFPYVETDDQMAAIVDTKADMERARPMDRLVCGDVGYGKTEVALRAAFKAVQDGKQVAVLVPTTVLAQQHWATFTRRLMPYPMRIEVLSRFRTPGEKRQVIEDVRAGGVDIVIGTHSLLGSRVGFKDLGLLIVDEEQRFGVAAKEKLKQLRTSVDVLTLTATPIPRTLYFSLSGIRDVSRIETPPAERLPIISHVGPFDDAVVQQAIQRELDRDGQVFFVHNRISSIGLMEQKLRRLAPEAILAVAHGQMDERPLARIMAGFAEGRIDILLCTNIVESGLDIPNANTIIIDRADHFGLAELYQLRGRVGRSTVQAYGYFLYDRKGRMTPEARERLDTLREVAGLGAGYMIAMRDLELRGAGDILGPKQSGHVSSVGLDLYTRLLSHEVAALRALRDGTAPPAPEPQPVTIDLPITVGLPEGYVGDSTLRVQLYRRVASLGSEEEVRLFEEELADRFGPLPLPALNLTYQVRLKLAAARMGAGSITTDGNRFTLRADAIERLDRRFIEQLLGEGGIIGRRQLSFLRSGTPEQWKARLMAVVDGLAGRIAAASSEAAG